jgi:single-strand DNA-binding protein
MNVTFLIGNLTKDPQKVEGVEKTLCKLNLAVNANYTNADGERPVEFFMVSVWNKLAENCLKYLKKGSKIAVVGRMQNRSWEVDGVKRYAVEVVAEEVEFLSSPKTENKQEVKQESKKLEPINDEDLPF